jgi:hypothetical protein
MPLPSTQFQYQQRAEPIRALSTVPEVDKWVGDYPDRVVRRPFAVAMLVTGLFAPVAPQPAVTVDQWAYQQPVRGVVAPQRQPGQYAVDPVLVPVTPAAWQGSETVPTRLPPPRPAGVFTVEPSPLRPVAAGDWQGFDDYRRPAPRVDVRPWFAGPTTLVASTEVITLDKWLWTWPQPDRTRHPVNPASGGKLPDRVAPTPDLSTWYSPASQPSRRVLQRVQTDTVNAPSPVVGADWQGIQAQPQRQRARASAGGTFAPVYVPVVAVDHGPLDWLGFASQPRQRRTAPPGSGEVTVTFTAATAAESSPIAGRLRILVESAHHLTLQVAP